VSLLETASPTESFDDAGVDQVDVAIVGAGFSGLGVAIRLRKAGIDSFTILESADSLGGAWRDNTYPGCGCDIPSPLYSYSYAQKSDWSRLYAGQPEILDYLRGVARRWKLDEHTVFNARVVSAEWDEPISRWNIRLENGGRVRARFFVSAIGPLHYPSIPDLPGMDKFGGPIFHSAQWRHDVDLTGKRVAVVGAGASAIQFVPAIVDRVESLTLFQRTAPWIVPKADRLFDARTRWLMRWLRPYRSWVRNRLFWKHEERAAGFLGEPGAMEATERLARKLLARQVPDPELRERLTPDYDIGCKRLLISSEWYPAVSRANVTVRSTGVKELRPRTIVGTDGSVTSADVLIFGTGFDAQETLTRMAIVGRNGRTLAEAWATGNDAFLGTAVSGFPNLFIMVGPNTGLGHNSQVFMIEAQARYITRCIRRLRRRSHGTIEPRAEAESSYNAWLQDRLSHTVWQTGGCRSWYQDARSGQNTVLWPDTAVSFWRKTRRVRFADFLIGSGR
jgi:cation diffusion facilitator CzcD-associated flavoprotein CzcO